MYTLKTLSTIFKMRGEHLFYRFNLIEFSSTLFILQLSQSEACAGRNDGKLKTNQ